MKLIRTAYAYTGVIAATTTMALGSGRAFAAPVINTSTTLNIAGDGNLTSLTGSGDLKTKIASIAQQALEIILLLSGILAVFYLIYSGVQYITSAGSPDKVKTARQGIINAVIGIIIIVAAFFIIRVALSVGNAAATSDTNTPQI